MSVDPGAVRRKVTEERVFEPASSHHPGAVRRKVTEERVFEPAPSHHPGAVRRKVTEERVFEPAPSQLSDVVPQREPSGGGYFWLLVFFVVYCARPEDWIPGLKVIPLAKISGLFAALALLLTIGRSKRQLQDIPIEFWCTLLLAGWLTGSSFFSPIWRGGAFYESLDFDKLVVVMLVGVLVITSLGRLRRLLFVQAASVAMVSAISLAIGHSTLRIKGVLGGMYDNSNDLAFAIALTFPLSFAFLLRRRSVLTRVFWAGANLVMGVALFLTGSRGGVITFGVAILVCVWHFGVQGRRPPLVFATILAILALFVATGGIVTQRFSAMTGSTSNSFQGSAYDSYVQRRILIDLSLNALADHPLFGLGAGNFTVYSGVWREVHVSYLEVAVEGGLPALAFYLIIFWRGFSNLKRLRRIDLDPETQIFAWALHGVMVGFVVGALFSPDAYQYFPFFTVMYTAVLRLTVQEQDRPRNSRLIQENPQRAGFALSAGGLHSYLPPPWRSATSVHGVSSKPLMHLATQSNTLGWRCPPEPGSHDGRGQAGSDTKTQQRDT